MQKRGYVAIAGVLAAIGAGMLAYRWFVLGFGWSGRGSTVLMVLPIAMIAGSVQGMRAAGGDVRLVPWWARALIAIPGLAIGAGVGFAIAPTLGHLSLDDREAGAVTIALPHGEVESASNEAVGKLEIMRAGGFDVGVAVTWQGGAVDDEIAKAAVDGAVRALGGTGSLVDRDDFRVGDGIAHRSVSIEKDGSTGWLTVFSCGPSMYLVLALGDGSEGLQRRVLATVRCHAKPGDAAPALPIAFDAPPGWTAQPTELGQLAWASADAGLLVRPITGGGDDGVAAVMRAATNGAAVLGEPQRGTGPDGPRTTWDTTITLEGQVTHALVAAWDCPGRDIRLMAMYLALASPDTSAGMPIIDRVRCARP